MRTEFDLSHSHFYNSWELLEEINKKYLKIEEDEITFTNIDFKNSNHFSFKIPSIYSYIKFVKCSFKNPEDGNFSGGNFKLSKSQEINLENCRAQNFSFENCGNVSIVGGQAEQLSFDKVGGLFFDLKRVKSIIIRSSTFNSKVKLQELNLQYFVLTNTVINKRFEIHKCNIEQITFEQNKHTGGVFSVRECNFGENISISGFESVKCIFEKNSSDLLTITNSNIEDLALLANKLSIAVKKSKSNSLRVEKNEGQYLQIYGNLIQGKVVFKQNVTEKIEIQNQLIGEFDLIKNSGVLNIRSCKIPKDSSILIDHKEDVFISKIDESECRWKVNVTNFSGLIFSGVNMDQLIINGLSGGDLRFKDSKINDLQVLNIQLDSMAIEACILKKINIKAGSCENLEISKNIESSFDLSLKNQRFKECLIQENSIGNVFFGAITCDAMLYQQLNSEKIVAIDFTCINSTIGSFLVKEAPHKRLKVRKSDITIFKFSKSLLEHVEIDEVVDFDLVVVGGDVPRVEIEQGWLINLSQTAKLELNKCTVKNWKLDVLFPNENPQKAPKKLNVSVKNTEVDECRIDRFNMGEYRSLEGRYRKIIFEKKKKSASGLVNIDLNQDTISELKITNHITNRIRVADCSIEKMELSHGNYGAIEIQHAFESKQEYDIGNFSLSSCVAKSLKLIGLSVEKLELDSFKTNVVTINKLKSNHIVFDQFDSTSISDGSYSMNSVNLNERGHASIVFLNCDLSKFNFNSCYFDSFKELIIQASKVDEIKCTSTTWPDRVTAYSDESRIELHQFEIKEACRQLKLAMGNHQDRVNELKFHALEMNAYREIVFKRWWDPKKLNDVLSLLAGSTNKFGLNWLRPLLIVFVLINANYWLILVSHYGYDISFAEMYCNHFNWTDYFSLYNPTHRLIHMNLVGDVSGGTSFLNFSSKIISAFFLYQLVVAFRKFRK